QIEPGAGVADHGDVLLMLDHAVEPDPAPHLLGQRGTSSLPRPGGDLALGGADLAAAFMEHDLIDELRLYVHPIVIGRGKPLFQPSDAKVELRLAETRAFGNGVVLLRYRRP